MPTSPLEDVEQGTLNSPDISPSGTVRKRAITSGAQAYSVASKLEADHAPKNRVDAVIDRKFAGGLPREPADLEGSGEKWRYNFSTGFMNGIISKVIPAPVSMIDGAQYLTQSRLPESMEDSDKKTDFYRSKITSAVRSWDGWRSFNYSLWTEDVIQGACIALCLQPYSPWPEVFRQDKAFLPQGTGQEMKNVPVLAAKKDYLVHEFTDFISDRSAAEDAGWDTEAAIKAVNDALPKTIGINAEVNTRTYEDAIREGNPGAAYSGAKVISVWHVLATEPETHKVTRFIVNRNGNHEILFQKDDEFESMQHVGVLFTLEPGNSTFYGSRGLGRILLNMHIACEANRNLLFDQLRIAGLNILKMDNTKSPTVEMQIQHPFLTLISDGTLEQTKLEPNVDAFKEADNLLARWAEQAAGSYISDLAGEDGGAHPTATEESIRAQREQQFKIAFLSRAWGQFAELFSLVQKRFYDKESTEPAVKAFQKELAEFGITDEEHKLLAYSQTSEVAHDTTQDHAQKLLAAYQMFKDDPDFDQYKLKDRVSTAVVDPQFTKDLLLDPQNAQANEIEAYRQQMLENEAMLDGAPMPVSPRDLHEVHLKVGLQEMQKGIPNLAKTGDPKLLDSFTLALQHFEAHLQTWAQMGATPDQLRVFKQALEVFDKAVTGVAQEVQKRAQEGANNAQQGPQNAPGAQSGMPAPQNQQDPNAPEPIHPEEHMLKITSSIGYKDAPPSIRRQIEAAAGLRPATDDEDYAWRAHGSSGAGPTPPAETATPAA